MQTLKLIGKAEQALPPEVDINFQGKSVPRLALTEVYLWNAGKQMIRRDQIVEDDPLRCEFESGDEILKAHVAAVTRTVNKLTVSVSQAAKYKAIIDFDYLDPNDGARIELLHTSKLRYPQVIGTLRGIPKGVAQLTPTRKISSFLRLIFLRNTELIYVAFVVGLMTFVAAFLPDTSLSILKDFLEPKKHQTGNLYPLRLALIILGVLYTIVPGRILLTRRRKYPKNLGKDIEERQKTER